MLGRCNRLRSNFIKNQNNSLGPAGAWFGSVSPQRGVRRPDMALQFTKRRQKMAFLVVAGRLGRDGHLGKIPSGTSILKFSLADDVGYGAKKTTQWISCAIFGKRAEKLAPFLKRGHIVEVCGSPVVNTYQSKSGEYKAELQLSVNDIKLLGKDKPAEPENELLTEVNQAPGKDTFDDEIPF